MHYEFELGHNVEEETKNICCMKDKDTVDHSAVTRWLKNCLCCKKLDNQAKSGRPKTVDSEAILQAIEANPMSNTLPKPSTTSRSLLAGFGIW